MKNPDPRDIGFVNSPVLKETLVKGIRQVILDRGDVDDFLYNYISNLALARIWQYDEESYLTDLATIYDNRVNSVQHLLRIGAKINLGKMIIYVEITDSDFPDVEYDLGSWTFFFGGYTEDFFAEAVKKRIDVYISKIEPPPPEEETPEEQSA